MGDMSEKSDEKTYIQRIGICRRCPHAKSKLLGTNCELCGCNIRLKARVKSEECPVKKW